VNRSGQAYFILTWHAYCFLPHKLLYEKTILFVAAAAAAAIAYSIVSKKNNLK
jgi:hypothetical protein